MKKILCLIIDCKPVEDWSVTYEVHRDIWNKWLDRHPDVDGYFIYSDPDLASEYSTNGRNFTVRGEERIDSILGKTQKAIGVLLKDHDYVIRTNISSLYDFRLLQRRNPCVNDLYAGHLWPMNSRDHQGVVGDGFYVAGSGILLSNDTARKLLTPVPDITLNPWDDIAIAQILQAQGIYPQRDPWFWFNYAKGMEQIVVGEHTHYRLRDERDPHRIREREVKKQIFTELMKTQRPAMSVSELPFYCIHVTAASDRRRHFEDQFRQISAKRLTVVEALTPTSPEVTDHYGLGFPRDLPKWVTLGTVACFASHLKALRTFVEGSTDPYAIICEDDVCFRKDFSHALQGVWENMPEGCPLVALSYWHERAELTPSTWAGRDPTRRNLAPIGHTAGAVLYLISREWAIEALTRFDRPLKDIKAQMRTSEAITLSSGGLLAHPLLAIERPNNTSLIVPNDPRHISKHWAFFRRWGFENFLIDARYVFDPAQSTSTIVTGFPTVILEHSHEDTDVIVPGRHERDLIDWSKQLSPTTRQFVDVGAHVGSWTLVMATQFREVHAFEPRRLTFQQLCGNIALNGLENVFVHNVGIETTLDSFADVLTDVGLMKIDVGDQVPLLLEGAAEVIRINELPSLMIECGAYAEQPQKKRALLDFLEDLGYFLVPIRGYPNVLLAESR